MKIITEDQFRSLALYIRTLALDGDGEPVWLRKLRKVK